MSHQHCARQPKCADWLRSYLPLTKIPQYKFFSVLFGKRRREKFHCGLNFDGDVSRSLLPTWKGGQWPTKKKKTVSHKKQNTKKQTNKHSYGLYKDHSAKFSHSIVSPFWFGWFTYSISLNGCSDAMTMCSTCRSKGNSLISITS